MKDWAGFLALAEKLANESGNAELRSAVSRAYYSAYQDARRFANESDTTFALSSPDEPHARVWRWFTGKPGKIGQVSTLGSGLRSKRNKADYEVYAGLTFLKAEVDDAIGKARRILTLLEYARAERGGGPAGRR